MKPESRKRLTDFINRAEKIQSYSYFKNPENIVGFKITKLGKKDVIKFHQPNIEKTEAILFNLRLFIDNKDDISIGRLIDLCDDPYITDLWKNEYKEIRDWLNYYLDFISVESPKGNLSHRDILNMFLYGSLGHRSEKDKSYKLYHQWVTDKNIEEILYNDFQVTVVKILVAIINISKASKEEINRQK